jgi:hypothetical protein
MGNDPRFAAARAGEDQERTLGAGHRFTLLCVQPCEEIHCGGEEFKFSM